MIADCEGNKIKWLLITGATSTTPINRWIKPRVGDIYQVEFPDNNTFLNNNINIGKVKADISAEAFYQEVHTHLQEFFYPSERISETTPLSGKLKNRH